MRCCAQPSDSLTRKFVVRIDHIDRPLQTEVLTEAFFHPLTPGSSVTMWKPSIRQSRSRIDGSLTGTRGARVTKRYEQYLFDTMRCISLVLPLHVYFRFDFCSGHYHSATSLDPL